MKQKELTPPAPAALAPASAPTSAAPATKEISAAGPGPGSRSRASAPAPAQSALPDFTGVRATASGRAAQNAAEATEADMLLPPSETMPTTNAHPAPDTIGKPSRTQEGEKEDAGKEDAYMSQTETSGSGAAAEARVRGRRAELVSPSVAGRLSEDEEGHNATEAMTSTSLLIGAEAKPSDAGPSSGIAGLAAKAAALLAQRKRRDLEQVVDESDTNLLMESGDRLHRVAVIAHTFIQDLRPPKLKQSSALPALKPKSRAECERRCGADGFCDPSSILGCGGLHCSDVDMLY